MKFLLTKTNIIIFAVLAAIIIGGAYYYDNKVDNLKSEVETERNLKMALTDSVDTYINKHNEVVSEKLTLQTKIKDLNEINGNLNQNQKNY